MPLNLDNFNEVKLRANKKSRSHKTPTFFKFDAAFRPDQTKILPVISGGMDNPIIVKIVGARPPNLPPGLIPPFQLLSMIKKGTGFIVWAVFGVPSPLTI